MTAAAEEVRALPEVPRAEASGTVGRPRRSVDQNWYRVLDQPVEDTLCAICLDDEDGEHSVYVELACGNRHCFHRDCIDACLTGAFTP